MLIIIQIEQKEEIHNEDKICLKKYQVTIQLYDRIVSHVCHHL